MKNKIKLFTVDLDGTLLDEKKDGKKVISKKNIQAINDAKQRGIDIVISTGRVGKSGLSIAESVPNNYVITANGAEIYDLKRKVIYTSKLSVQQGLKILDIVQRYKLSIKPDNSYTSYGSVRWFQKYLSKKIGWIAKPGYTYSLLEEHLKFVIFGSLSKKKLRKVKAEINEIKGVVAVSSMNGYTIEVNAEGATKGKAAEFLANRLGLKKSEIAHIGDTMNDSTARGKVGELIVMKNASKELKKIGTHIGPHYKNGGVGKILSGQYKKISK